MKQGRLTLLLILLLASAAVLGKERHYWSLDANLGLAHGETGARELTAQLADSGLDASAVSGDASRFAWQLRLGYSFTPRWGLEIGYVDLGEVETRISGATLDIDAFLAASRDIHQNTAQGILLGGVYRHPLGRIPQLEGVVRAGALVWRSDYDLVSASRTLEVEENGTGLSFGLGLSLGLDRLGSLPSGMAAQLEWQHFDLDGEGIDLISLGLSYRFQ